LFERRFDLDRCLLGLRGRGQDLARVVDRLLGLCEVPLSAVAHPDVTIEIDRCAQPPAMPARGPRFLFPPMLAFESASGWLLCDEVGQLEVEPERGRIVGAVWRDADLTALSGFATLTLWVAVIECLRARGRYPLHAAAVVSPGGETLLLPGTRCAGKSTMTLALIEAGYSMLSDDTVWVERTRAGAIELVGCRRRFHVRPDLVARRADLAALVRDLERFEPPDKKWLALEERFPDRIRRRAPAPSRIGFPEIVDEPGSRRVELSPRQTLLRLFAHSAFVFVRPQLAPGHLALLRALADGAPAAQLLCGRDVLTEPNQYLALLEGTALWTSAALASS